VCATKSRARYEESGSTAAPGMAAARFTTPVHPAVGVAIVVMSFAFAVMFPSVDAVAVTAIVPPLPIVTGEGSFHELPFTSLAKPLLMTVPAAPLSVRMTLEYDADLRAV